MGRLLRDAASEQRLLEAWDDVRDSAYEQGKPGPEVMKFEGKAAKNVSRISSELLAGEWEPSPVVHVKIAKRSGGFRHLAVPCVEDRVVERSILAVLDPEIDPLLLPWSFAYRRGMGPADAIRELVAARERGYGWVVRCDIEDCFDRLPRFEVLRRLEAEVTDRELIGLIWALVKRPVVGKGRRRLPRGRGLHQGSPLSPLLTNLYLDAFDRRLLTDRLQVIRFADDIAIPVRDRAAGQVALEKAREAALSLDLELNAAKSDVVSFDSGLDFLGRTITNSTGAGMADMSHPTETTVYVHHQGALIRSKGDRMTVTASGETLLRVSYRRVRQVVIFGRVGLTTAFLRQAIKRGIEVVLLDEHGKNPGVFVPEYRSDVLARREQYRVEGKRSLALRLAKGFVAGKLQNQRVLLLKIDRLTEPELGPWIRRIDQARDFARDARSQEELMGVEGAAARDYYAAVRQLFSAPWGFEGRVRRPPTDPVNAMLSYGYTILTQEAVAAVAASGLDTHAGFLHSGRSGSPALALDLMEEFRPLIVDQVVFRIARSEFLTPDDFEMTEDAGCRMSESARNLLLERYERRMLTLLTHPINRRRVSYRVALGMQAKLVHAALTRGEEYRPLLWK